MKKSNGVLLALAGILAILSGMALFLVDTNLISGGYELGLYQKTTLEDFVSLNGEIGITYFASQETRSIDDKENQIRPKLKTINFADDGNSFPYQFQDDTYYTDLILENGCYDFRMDETRTKVALEYSIEENLVWHKAVRYYSCTQMEGQNLYDFAINL